MFALDAINVTPMSDREEVNLISRDVEGVDDPIIADASAEAIGSFKAVVRVRSQSQTRSHRF
jgi:hypothetical protein